MAKILIADDNDSLRTALRKTLSCRPGWSICGEASDGVSALSLAEQLKPDLVILDFLMPLQNGLAVATELRQKLPGVPVVLYTLHMTSQLEREAYRVGVRKVVSKTETFQKFVESLEEFIGDASRTIGPLAVPIDGGEPPTGAATLIEDISASSLCDPPAKSPGETPVS